MESLSFIKEIILYMHFWLYYIIFISFQILLTFIIEIKDEKYLIH